MSRCYLHRVRILQFAAVLVVCLSCGQENNPDRRMLEPAALLPPIPREWRQSGETLTFTGIALSDYINGGAEAYFAYGFQELAVREFRDAGGTKLTVEIYAMDSPENAYGIFSTDSAGECWHIGADSCYSDGLLRFWKGPCFVRIMCYPPNPSIEAAMRETGSKIADAIHAESRRPEILSVLPEHGYLADTVCYFHRQTSLNNIRFLSGENLLHLGDDVETLTWEQWVSEAGAPRPGEAGEKLRLIVVRYPVGTKASAAFRDFVDGYMPVRRVSSTDEGANEPLAAQLPDGTYGAAGLEACWLLIVLDADSSESAARALKHVRKKLSAPTPIKKENHHVERQE